MRTKVLTAFAFAFLLSLQTGCGIFSEAFSGVSDTLGLTETGTVIAKSAQIRTSYAVVAGDLLEVKRGDQLEILDQIEFEKVLWYSVRANDEAKTEGWIEAQHVITGELLDKARKLTEDFKDRQPQAAGQLRAASNLRLTPEMGSDNVLLKLANGSNFEIMDWRFVPKQEVSDVDDSSGGNQKKRSIARNEEIEAARVHGEPEKLDEKYDMWYLIRLDPSVSPAPAGWLFGRQVELLVPSDIVFFQANNRKYVAWQRLDTDTASRVASNDRVSTPGNWVILSRTNQVKAIDGVEPEFDAIQILAYDKYDQGYYTAFRTSTDVWGRLPLRIEGSGDNKTFTVLLRNPNGQMDEKRFVVFRDRSRIKVTPPEDLGQYQQKR